MTEDEKEIDPMKENAIVGWVGDTLDVRKAETVMVLVDGKVITVSNEQARALVDFPDDAPRDADTL